MLLVLRQAEKQCDLRTQGEVISSKQCLSGKFEMAIPLVHSNVAEALGIRSTQIIEECTLEHARSSETLRFASCAKDCEGPWLETLTYSFGDIALLHLHPTDGKIGSFAAETLRIGHAVEGTDNAFVLLGTIARSGTTPAGGHYIAHRRTQEG